MVSRVGETSISRIRCNVDLKRVLEFLANFFRFMYTMTLMGRLLLLISFLSLGIAQDTLVVREISQQSSIQDFAAALSRQYEVNLTVDADVKVTDRFRFYNVKLGELVTFLADKYNLQVIRQNSIIRLANKPKEEVKPQKPIVDIRLARDSLSVNLSGVALSDVVDKLAELTGRSFLLKPRTSGRISGRLNRIPLEKALTELFDLNGFRIYARSGIYRIERKYNMVSSDDQNARVSGYFIDYADSLIRVDAPNAPLEVVIKDLMRQSNQNVMFYTKITGDISVRLAERNLDELLIKLFRNTGYTFKVRDNVYFIGSKDIKDLNVQEIIPLTYLRAGEGSRSSYRPPSSLNQSSFNASRLQNTNYSSQSTTSLTNTTSSGRSVRRANTTQQSGGSNRVTGASADALFAELNKKNIQAVPVVEQNAILVSGTKQDIQDAKELVKLLDRPIPQIFIEALIIDVKNNADLAREIQAYRAGTDTIKTSTSYIPFEMLFNAKDLNPITTAIGEALGAKRIGILPKDFYLFVSQQESKNNIKINSRPQITTTNGEEAYITIGETRYFKLPTRYYQNVVQQPQDNTQGITVREEYQRLDIVNTLRVRPWANQNGDVTVHITPQFQTPVSSTGTDAPPSIEFRELDSTVRLKNGQTLILGGLVRDESYDLTTDYFPLLSWIPWIGDWFVSTTKQDGRSELLIYITPTVYYGDKPKPTIKQSDFK